ncbi:SDR family oxidoreductase [Chakrabartyella piscis]|uniref:SDR family NAD(P)-dependent oxidoreductase n=1 Tax=Chakrabartyella piscis TaxID=2918914 RepID=UPI0029586AC1|nr:SDR family oxidoreductase [Chakrabartyella piscis]
MEKKAALVTGASHGIGKAIAIALAKNGYDVGVNYCRNEAGAKDTCAQIESAGGRAIAIQADVGNMESLKNMFQTFAKFAPSLDLMVNNAGVSEFYPLLEATEEQWQHVTNTDWKSVYFGTQMAAKNMVAHKKAGVIINITSNHVDGCFPLATIYAPTKAASTKFAENAAVELAPYGIRILSLAPGYTNVWADDHPIQEVKDRILSKRFAAPEEIAEILVFLASEKCSYMTGTRVTVDGGALLPVVPENAMDAEFVPPLS